MAVVATIFRSGIKIWLNAFSFCSHLPISQPDIPISSTAPCGPLERIAATPISEKTSGANFSADLVCIVRANPNATIQTSHEVASGLESASIA